MQLVMGPALFVTSAHGAICVVNKYGGHMQLVMGPVLLLFVLNGVLCCLSSLARYQFRNLVSSGFG